MYAPTGKEAGWIRLIRTGMTEGGCDWFKENRAAELVQSQSSNISSSTGFIAKVKTIDEDIQLWKAQITVFTPGKETNLDLFVLARRDNDRS